MEIGVVSTCLPTLRPLYSLAVRGHYCRSNEICTRCREASSRSTSNPKLWGLWKLSSATTRQDSNQSTMPGSASSMGEKADPESQRPGTGKQKQQTRLFSIMDQPLWDFLWLGIRMWRNRMSSHPTYQDETIVYFAACAEIFMSAKPWSWESELYPWLYWRPY